MGKIQQFKNKPTAYTFGQYYYENDDMDNFESLDESDSIKKPVDKYSDKSLHSSVVSDETRDYIVGNKLRFVGVSGIRINNLRVKENSTSNTHINTDFRGFICDRNTFDCFRDDGSIRDYRNIDDFFRETSEDPITDYETCQFFRLQPGNIDNNGEPDLNFLEGKNIIKNLSPDLSTELQLQSGDYLSPIDRNIDTGIENMIATGSDLWDSAVDKSNFIPFKPNDDITDSENRLTSIFSENLPVDNNGNYQESLENYIQIVIWLKSNSKKSRKRRFYVLKVKPTELMDIGDGVAKAGELANTPIVVAHNDGMLHRDGHESKSNSDCDKAAWYISNLSVTFNLDAGVNPDFYNQFDQTIVKSVEPQNPISENEFDLDFTSINLLQESFTSANASEYFWTKKFTPFSEITILNRADKNLQGFKTDDLDRQICSSPTAVRLKINIAVDNKKDNDDKIIIKQAFAPDISPHYKFCVVHWDDINNEFETVQDVFSKKPTDFNEVLIAQDNNTFIFKDHSENLTNTYTTPGIKQIKILVFSYIGYKNDSWSGNYLNSELPPFDKIEPMRYNLLTSRIFLDIPISEFEDFGELGGSEYRTIPWPYTNPIIGGVSKDSKYLKSIDDILGGGKVGNQDIIDETFLVNAKENNELGENIELMDLEQVRYFDKSYDMNTLLLMPTSGETGWGDYELAKQSDLIVGLSDNSAGAQYFGDIGGWNNGAVEIIFNGTNEYKMYMNNPNTFNNILLKNEVIFDGTFYDNEQPLLYKTYGPSLNIESFISEETVGEFFKNENFTPTLDELEVEDQNSGGFIKTRNNGTSTYYQGYGWFGSVNEVLMSTFQSGPEVYEELAPIINLNPDGTSSTVEWVQFLNQSNQDTQFSHPDFPVLFYYYQDMELYNENGEMRLTELKMGESVPLPVGMFTTIVIPDKLYTSDLNGEIQFLNESISVQEFFQLPLPVEVTIPHPYTEKEFWNADPDFPGKIFPEESSVGQIFISDNQDKNLKQSCKLELNTGELSGKSIYDSSGEGNKGLLIGDYKVKKVRKGEKMRKDSFIKVPNKVGNDNGAL